MILHSLKLQIWIILATNFYHEVCGALYTTKVYRYLDSHNKSHCTIWTPRKSDKSLPKFSQFGDYFHVESFPGLFHSPFDGPEEEPGKPSGGSFGQFKPEIFEYFYQDHNSKPRRLESQINSSCEYREYEDSSYNPDEPESYMLSPLMKLFSTPEKDKKPATKNANLNPNVMTLVGGGPAKNRIDVVFLGDGYMKSERDKFFSDVTRLVTEIFIGEPFSEFLPLLNIYARFTPSVQSGIGYNGVPKNTYYQLYRSKGTALRAIYLKNVKKARKACMKNGPSGCEYPVIIANDPYYGGLGGEFAISTASERTGAIVLRHELGHNFAKVGEEYDSGEVYVGPNTSPSLSSLKWEHWIDAFPPNGKVKEEETNPRILGYPNADLLKKNVEFTFMSDGTYAGWYLIVTLSGAMENDSVEIKMDGENLQWKSSGSDDKEIYTWINETSPLSDGVHTLEIYATDAARNRSSSPPEGTNLKSRIPLQVGSVSLYEFGGKREYHTNNSFVGAFPTWDYRGVKSYRPTGNGCVMRNMTHHSLCSICKESIWLQFLRRTSLIDSLEIGGQAGLGLGFLVGRKVTLNVLPLGQFRKEGRPIPGEKVDIRWSRNNVLLPEFDGKTEIRASKGQWEVTVTFVTPHVRKDPNGYLQDKKSFKIS